MINFFKISVVGILLVSFGVSSAIAYEDRKNIPELNIYRVEPDLLDSYDVIKKGTSLNLILLNDVFTNGSKENSEVNFEVPVEDEAGFKISGSLTMLSHGGRFSKPSSIGFLANKLYLDNGQEINLSAYSSVFTGIHPPHANISSIGLARTITNLAIAGGPLTFGASFGISFLASGLLSAYQNGFYDFIWGGLDGTGLSYIEAIFRKQPELYIGSESLIPFTLSEDLKINKGIQKERAETINLPSVEALKKIDQLLKWGDLAGALELSIKAGQKEKYQEIMRKISS